MKRIEFAIKMEQDGERYYREQAAKHHGLEPVFLMLAEDERSHAAVLMRRVENASYELDDNDILTDARNVFHGKTDFKMEIKPEPEQIDLYRAGMEMEKESIALYSELLAAATEDSDKELFGFLVKEEKAHHAILEELVILINRPNEWVESAEFGLREEY
ncbi:MAG: rubrerythrin [Firmicutes bacterium HGW-Firmicutes-11]|jgi:rubrerythrin|nr:MAG: rubrerythrin [Firmicutes bacterium HGW-Firmicutes-11]